MRSACLLNNREAMNKITLILLSILLPILVFGQFRTDMEVPELGLKATPGSYSGTSSLFDPERLQIQHGYSMQMGTIGGRTISQGLLQSTFQYYVNPQVSVQGFVGLLHQPFGNSELAASRAGGIAGISMDNILVGGEVTYRPRENMVLQFGFSRQPANTYRSMLIPYDLRGR